MQWLRPKTVLTAHAFVDLIRRNPRKSVFVLQLFTIMQQIMVPDADLQKAHVHVALSCKGYVPLPRYQGQTHFHNCGREIWQLINAVSGSPSVPESFYSERWIDQLSCET